MQGSLGTLWGPALVRRGPRMVSEGRTDRCGLLTCDLVIWQDCRSQLWWQPWFGPEVNSASAILGQHCFPGLQTCLPVQSRTFGPSLILNLADFLPQNSNSEPEVVDEEF